MTIVHKGDRSVARHMATLIALLSSATAANAQAGQKSLTERYDRAARLMPAPALAGVLNQTIVPHWIGDTNRFWYRRQTDAGTEFVVVDAPTGQKTAAFDGQAVATSLATILKRKVSVFNLPFDNFKFAGDGNEIVFHLEGKNFKCDVGPGGCQASVSLEPYLITSPDGRRAVLSRDGNLFLRELATGTERALTTDGNAEKGWGILPEPSDSLALQREPGSLRAPYWAYWSPDSRRIIVSYTDTNEVLPYPYIDYVPADGSFRPRALSIKLALAGEKPALTTLHIVDVNTGQRRTIDLDSTRIDTQNWIPRISGWSPDGFQFRFFANWADEKGASLYEVNTATGAVREVIKEKSVAPASLNAGGYGAPNVALINGGREAIWSSQRDGWTHLYRYDIASGRQMRRLTHGPWTVRELLRADDRLQRIFFVANGREPGNPYLRSIYSVGYDGRGLRLLTPEPGDKPVANPRSYGSDRSGAFPADPVSADGKFIVYSHSTLAKPSVTVLRQIEGSQSSRILEQADASRLLAAGYRPPSEFVVKAADRKSDLWGVIYRPSDYDPGKKYPVLLAQYNSPIVGATPRNFGSGYSMVHDRSTPAAEAELGIIVVAVDPRGTPFRGAAFSNPPPGWLADMGLIDQVAAIRELARRDPSMDLTRVGIGGTSFGGWTTLRALIEHNDFFTVGVAWAPPGAFHNQYELRSHTASLDLPRYSDGTGIRPTPNAKPRNWAMADSIAQVGLLRGRLLLGGGGLDENVLPGSYLQFFQAAAAANKDVEQIFVPSATHTQIPVWPYVVKRTWDFLVRTLLGETPPNDYKFPEGTFPAGPGSAD